ncbi:hypothetical protein GCK32_012270, partial [Trichostrongylus colubriformis]
MLRPGSSTEALPASSREASYRSLSSLPRVDSDNNDDDLINDVKPVIFRRRFLRDGYKSISGRDVHMSSANSSEDPNIALMSPFKRASLLRRSICAIRKSVNRRHRMEVQGSSVNNGFMEENQRDSHVYEEPVLTATDSSVATNGDTTKTKKFKWKRFFPFRLRKGRGSDKNEQSSCGPLCVYAGFGRTFERIHPGEEIAIVVFGG